MKRKIYSKIKEWKSKWNGKTAILVYGARRIRKSRDGIIYLRIYMTGLL